MLDPESDTKEARAVPDVAVASFASTEKVGPLTALRIQNFRLLLIGHILNQAGGWIQQITVNWLVYSLTGSGTMLGSISIIRAVTSLGMMPVSGILIDRVNRRKLMLISCGWSFTITLGLGLILVFSRSQISYLFIFAFLGGLTYTIDQTLRQVVVFDLVPRTVTPNALAFLVTGAALMRSFGPAIGGFLIIWFGPMSQPGNLAGIHPPRYLTTTWLPTPLLKRP